MHARFGLLATGFVDHFPPIEGEPNCPSEALRFCPICDGYEAIDRRVGILEDVTDGGKKALFLRAYQRRLTFLTDETASDAVTQRKLDEENVRVVGKFKRITLANDSNVAVVTENGERHELDALYPALGCTVRARR